MSSGYSPWYYRHVLYKIPGLFKKCPEGNHHWFWERLCLCRCNEHDGEWHGGILDMHTGRELIPWRDVEAFWMGISPREPVLADDELDAVALAPVVLPKGTFVCSICGRTFKKGQTEDEALAARAKDFNHEGTEGCSLVCEDCFFKLTGKEHP